MIDKVRFSNLCEQNGIFLDEVMLERFDIYARLLVEWNEKMNLTAITEPREIELKHFLDSLMLIKYAKCEQCNRHRCRRRPPLYADFDI